VSNIAIYGFGDVTVLDDGDIRVGVAAASPTFTGILIENNIIGTGAASFTDPGAASRTPLGSIAVYHADLGIIRNNLVGFAGYFGIFLGDSTNYTVQSNEIRGTGIINSQYDGIDIGSGSNGATIRDNLFAGNQGSGVDSYQGLGSNLIEDNTFEQNGLGGVEPAALRIFGDGNTLQFNNIQNNAGPGILIVRLEAGPLQGTPSTQNRISQNRFSSNGSNAIDLLAVGGDLSLGDGITLNDGGTDANAGNIGLDYPVINSATISAGTTTVMGTTCATCDVEVYRAIADGDLSDTLAGNDYGEGVAYLGTTTADAGGNFTFATTALALATLPLRPLRSPWAMTFQLSLLMAPIIPPSLVPMSR
jgi:hypothetical protein